MLDKVQIEVQGGDGGHGIVSYHRAKFVPQGGPDGGDGGHGGNVVIRAIDDVYTLEQYRSKKRYRAGQGVHGGPNLRTGAVGADTALHVPAGTVITNAETGDVVADLRQAGDSAIVALGGRGGWGNKRFATSTNQTPSFSQQGGPGEHRFLDLELRLLADVGLLGLPNAGKSTLLAAVSNAKPKVASYPFTTLEPMLGVVESGYDRFTLADLPGLVEGASEGYGLGFEFLKHVRRCRVLLHVVDSTSPDPVTDYELIEGEVRAYDERLASIPRVIAVTKADLGEEEARASARSLAGHTGHDVRVISAEAGEGTDSLMAELLAIVQAERERAATAPPDTIPVLRPEPRERFDVIEDGENRWVIDAPGMVIFVEMTNTGMPGSVDEILRRMERWGVARELRRRGAQIGDTVVFGAAEIPWEG